RVLEVRDYDGDPTRNLAPLAIHIEQQFSMNSSGILRMIFETDAWDSTIDFAAGIPVSRGGTLDLVFAAGVDPLGQIGRTFDLFDWPGVNPTGNFTVSSPYVWDLSKLYSTGEVALVAVPEPSAMALAAASLLGARLHRRARKIKPS